MLIDAIVDPACSVKDISSSRFLIFQFKLTWNSPRVETSTQSPSKFSSHYFEHFTQRQRPFGTASAVT